jgi:hypothetical protein
MWRVKKRLVEERRARLVHELCEVARQRGNVADVPLLDGGDERCVDVLIADAVRDHVHARGQKPASVLDVEQVRRGSEPALVRLVDERAVDRRRHVVRSAHDMELDEVDPEIRVAIHAAPDFLGGLDVPQARTGGVHPGPLERATLLFVAQFDRRPGCRPSRGRRPW